MGVVDPYAPLGGKPIDLDKQYGKVMLGKLHHPGDHPAFEGHIRWGLLEDGRPWVASSIREASGQWVFEGPRAGQDVELAITEIQAHRQDGLWAVKSAGSALQRR